MGTAQEIRQVANSLNPLRPPTAPASDIAQVKKDIVSTHGPNLLVIQIALVILLLCLIVYLFFPINYAHPIVILLSSVGLAVGIFLKK
jgi:hypothetical protein